jgi:hypothetical protein
MRKEGGENNYPQSSKYPDQPDANVECVICLNARFYRRIITYFIAGI